MTIDSLSTFFTIASTDLAFVFRIVLAGVLSGIIGWQRQRSGSPAGYRTHAMIAVATAAFTSISIDMFPTEIGRIIQGIVTGVGFLGSGIIWRAGAGSESGNGRTSVKGLTTAAGIWAVSAIGIMIGTGEYLMGISLFAIILFILILPPGKFKE